MVSPVCSYNSRTCYYICALVMAIQNHCLIPPLQTSHTLIILILRLEQPLVTFMYGREHMCCYIYNCTIYIYSYILYSYNVHYFKASIAEKNNLIIFQHKPIPHSPFLTFLLNSKFSYSFLNIIHLFMLVIHCFISTEKLPLA